MEEKQSWWPWMYFEGSVSGLKIYVENVPWESQTVDSIWEEWRVKVLRWGPLTLLQQLNPRFSTYQWDKMSQKSENYEFQMTRTCLDSISSSQLIQYSTYCSGACTWKKYSICSMYLGRGLSYTKLECTLIKNY